MNLKSVAEERKAALKAFAKVKRGEWAWHVHHEIIAEPIGDDCDANAKDRIHYIVRSKDAREQALRLRLMRPISKSWIKAHPEVRKAIQELNTVRDELNERPWHYALAEKRRRLTRKIQRLLKESYPQKKSTWSGRTIFPRGWEKKVSGL